MRRLLRAIEFAARFVIGTSNFGWDGAFRVFIRYRSRSTTEPVSIWLRKMSRRFYFRGAADRGVVSHFYKPGYRIVDGGSSGMVRYIVDAGANIGDETVRFRHFHPQATIVAIEAAEANYAVLQRNVSGDAHTLTLNKGLWSRACRLRVIPGTVNENYSVAEVDDPDAPYDIEAVSVDQIMREYGLPEIDILKMDIEGAERQVFASPTAAQWLPKVKIIILECPDNDSPGTTMAMFARLLELGQAFNCYIHGENLVLIRQGLSWRLVSDLFGDR